MTHFQISNDASAAPGTVLLSQTHKVTGSALLSPKSWDTASDRWHIKCCRAWRQTGVSGFLKRNGQDWKERRKKKTRKITLPSPSDSCNLRVQRSCHVKLQGKITYVNQWPGPQRSGGSQGWWLSGVLATKIRHCQVQLSLSISLSLFWSFHLSCSALPSPFLPSSLLHWLIFSIFLFSLNLLSLPFPPFHLPFISLSSPFHHPFPPFHLPFPPFHLLFPPFPSLDPLLI